MAEKAGAGTFHDDEDHEPAKDTSEEFGDHPYEHPSANVLDEPGPSEPLPLPAPASPLLQEDVGTNPPKLTRQSSSPRVTLSVVRNA